MDPNYPPPHMYQSGYYPPQQYYYPPPSANWNQTPTNYQLPMNFNPNLPPPMYVAHPGPVNMDGGNMPHNAYDGQTMYENQGDYDTDRRMSAESKRGNKRGGRGSRSYGRGNNSGRGRGGQSYNQRNDRDVTIDGAENFEYRSTQGNDNSSGQVENDSSEQQADDNSGGARQKQHQRGRGQRGRYPRRGRDNSRSYYNENYDVREDRYSAMDYRDSRNYDRNRGGSNNRNSREYSSRNDKRASFSNKPDKESEGISVDSEESSRKSTQDYKKPNRSDNSRGGRGNVKNINKSWRKPTEADQENQRGKLIDQLTSGTYECMVCCDAIRCEAAVWSCANCYHVFHLRCIKRWARQPNAVEENNGWRCPGCQNVSAHQPSSYKCFCGKTRDPEYSHYDIPHSCGEVCRKKRPGDCKHPCNILCHPGPCPPCQATITKNCDCGNTKKTVKCGASVSVKCEQVCQKSLNCGQHVCQEICHTGSCQPCDKVIHQECYCQQSSRDVICGTADSFVASFSCENPCGRTLECGNHHCTQPCHPGPCEMCHLVPEVVTKCCCGKTSLDKLGAKKRLSCLDPIAVCDKLCDKELPCGPPDAHHHCQGRCHEGECPPCDGVSEVECGCGAIAREVTCVEAKAYSEGTPLKCDKRCNRKKECGRHRCPEVCCMLESHPCQQICGLKLSCGTHRCEETCHRSRCPQCWQVSFEELRCHCGAEVLYPPIQCGTLPPECKNVCIRRHTCSHPVRHNCHAEERCPPCTELTERWCMGGHEKRQNIPCHLSDISCGLPCNKPLPCQQHKCQLTCHKGPCLQEGEKCTQPCPRLREECGHPCAAPCHSDTEVCPKTACKTEILLKCECGNLQERALCLIGGDESGGRDYQKMATMMMAMKMADVQAGQSIDISSLTGSDPAKKKARKLECNSECSIKERNRRLALALDIHNPELRASKWQPSYSDFLKSYAKQNASYVAGVEKALSELVLNAQTGKIPKRNHAFPPGNRDKRRLIHELAEFYGCASEAYGEEPNRNIVATAVKDKCWQPRVSLSNVVHGNKAPQPMPYRGREEDIRKSELDRNYPAMGGASAGPQSASSPGGSWASLVKSKPTAPVAPSSRSGVVPPSLTRLTSDKKTKAKPVDYFDMTD